MRQTVPPSAQPSPAANGALLKHLYDRLGHHVQPPLHRRGLHPGRQRPVDARRGGGGECAWGRSPGGGGGPRVLRSCAGRIIKTALGLSAPQRPDQTTRAAITYKEVFTTMDTEKLRSWQSWIRTELESSVNFWLKNGMDPEHGGIYTCLTREGKVFSTDKSVWMQGRCGWIFAHMCRLYGTRPEWLEASRSCLDFMEDHCINRSAGNRMYFTVTADGKPLRQRRYCFSEEFLCHRQCGILRHYRRQKMPGTGPPGLSAGIRSEPRRSRPHRPWPQNHPRNPKGARSGRPHDL